MATILLKTEPGEYSFDDLLREKTTVWSGVSNAAALKCLRECSKGDGVLVYHTGDEKRIVGLAVVSKGAYPDPELDDEKRVVIEIRAVKRVKTPVSLAMIKGDARFQDFALVRQSRLSVMVVPPELDRILRGLLGL